MRQTPRLSSAPSIAPGFMTRLAGLVTRSRALMLAGSLLAFSATGCDKKTPPKGPGPETPDLCAPVDCGDQGACVIVDDEALCACGSGYAGDACETCAPGYTEADDGTCQLEQTDVFDPSIYLAAKLFQPNESGRLEVTGKTGADARYNGYYIDIEAGSFSKPTWIVLTPAIGSGLPNPGGGMLLTAAGIEVLALPEGEEFQEDGSYNETNPQKPAPLLFKDHRGTVLFFNTAQNTFDSTISFSMVPQGTQGNLTHFSPYYLLDKPTAMNAAVTAPSEAPTNTDFYVDFTGTKDEGTADQLAYAVSTTAGTVTQLTATLFKVTQPPGSHAVTAKVIELNTADAKETIQQYNLDVSAPVTLSQVDVACAPNAITTGETSDCDATAKYSDNTQTPVDADCDWQATQGSIDQQGVLTPPLANTDVTASCTYGGLTGQDVVSVMPVITSLTVVCNPNSLMTGEAADCATTEHYSDASTQPAEGAVCSADLGTVDPTADADGKVGYSAPASIATSPVTDTVQCTLGGITGQASVAVASPQVECESAGGTYYGDACWKVAQNTVDTCNDVCSQVSLSCSLDPDWTVDETLCSQLTNGGSVTGSLDSNYSPAEVFGQCRQDTDNTRSCSEPAVAPYKRICKCE